MSSSAQASREGLDDVSHARVQFGGVVRQVTSAVSDPRAAGIERFVGLEHLDPGRLRIARWGMVQDGTTFTRRFQPGQVLFGKRRAYQRKVAVADFPGVCSGDILVFEADGSALLPELLPFIVQSEAFFQHALNTSAGSLSPRTRWRDLAAFEVVLPPLARQREVAELLGAGRQAAEAWQEVAEGARSAYRAALDHLVGSLYKKPDVLRPVAEVGEVQGGRQLSPSHRTGRFPRPYLRVANVFDGYFDLADVKEMDFTPAEQAVFSLRVGDILLNEGQSRELVGRSAICDEGVEGFCYQNTLIRFRSGPSVMTDYAHACFRHAQYSGRFAAIASQTTSIAHLGVDRFSRYLMPVPALEDQQAVVLQLSTIERGLRAANERASSSRQLLAALGNELLTAK